MAALGVEDTVQATGARTRRIGDLSRPRQRWHEVTTDGGPDHRLSPSRPVMRPLAETRAALSELAKADGLDLVDQFCLCADRIQDMVPGCVGLSLSIREGDLTFTWVSTGSPSPELDAVQYLDGGPCVDAVDTGEQVHVSTEDLLSESRWLLFARAEQAAGVASSLSMPVIHEGKVVGGVNLYGDAADTFIGHHDAIGDILGAWAPGAVTNADLSFTSRERAVSAPAALRSQATVEQAVGMIVAAQHLSTDQARARLRGAAQRAGMTEEEVAAFVVRTHLS